MALDLQITIGQLDRIEAELAAIRIDQAAIRTEQAKARLLLSVITRSLETLLFNPTLRLTIGQPRDKEIK